MLVRCDAKEMLAYQHSGFSVDAGVCIEAHDHAALERLLRYCARPSFAMDRLRKEGAALVYLWAVLIARIYEVFPLLCPICGGQMRIIAFITHSADIRQILDHIGVESEPPHISPARGPPLWDGCGDVPMDNGAQFEPDWDLAAQPAPDFDVDQRINW